MMLRPLFIATCIFLNSVLFAQQTEPEIMPDMRSRDLVYLGIKAHDRGHYDSALTIFNWVHPNDSNYSWAVAEKANTLLKVERYEEVIEVCEEALQRPIGHRGSLYMTLGTAYDESEQSDKALNAYERGIKESPMLVRLHFNKAITHVRRDEFQASYEALQRALEINPYHTSSHYLLGLLAIEQGDLVPGSLALSAFLMLENGSERALNALSTLNKALSEKTDMIDHGIDFGESFKKEELLLKNYAALRDAYEVPGDFTLPVIKQTHLLFEQLRINKNGWISNYYGPFFKEVVADDKLFEGWSNLVMRPSTSETHQKIVAANQSKVEKFVEWGDPNWNRSHQFVMDTLNGKQQELMYLRRGDKSIQAVGPWDKEADKPLGVLRFYDLNGTKSAVGYFDESGERTGSWKWYYDNGLLKETLDYEAGKSAGNGTFYDDSGKLSITQQWKDGERHGKRITYYVTGQPMSSSTYKEGDIDGVYESYYEQGQMDYTVNVSAGLQEGEAKGFYEDGEKMTISNFVEGKREGEFLRYYNSGQLSEQSFYKEDNYDGAYKSYYQSGQIQLEGTVIDGKRSGKWTAYNPDGTLDYIENYDENGKQNGVYQDFDFFGNIYQEIEYKKGEISAYRYFDLEGNVLSEQKAKRGKVEFTGLHANGAKSAVGAFVDNKKEGEWRYYNEHGVPTLTESYKDGKEDGESLNYYQDGTFKSIAKYTEGERTGLYVEYFPDSSLLAQGRYVKGLQQGPWYYYNPDGSRSSVLHIINGKLDGWQHYYTNAGIKSHSLYLREGLLLEYIYYSPKGDTLGSGKLEGGTGTMIWKYPNGQVAYSMEIKNGEYHGVGQSYYPNGHLKSKMYYAFDKADGDWEWYFLNGQMETKGRYENGERHGKWVWYSENGTKSSVTNYDFGKRVGEAKSYDSQGNILSLANYLNNELHGKRYLFGSDSVVALIRTYHYGYVQSYTYLGSNGKALPDKPIEKGSAKVKALYPNGKTAVTFTYNGGMFDSEYKRYYQNGNLMHQSTSDGGRDEGEMKEYYSTGKLEMEAYYVMDKRHGEVKEYYPNGKLKRQETYVYGSKEGKATVYDEDGKQLRTEFWFNDGLFSIK